MSANRDTLAVQRRQAQIDAEAMLDGISVLRTPWPAASWTRPAWCPPNPKLP